MRGNLFHWLRGWSPWCLRAEIKTLRSSIEAQNRVIGQLGKLPDEPTARAMLMQLRVYQDSVRRRTGYMVSAFIPNGVVARLVELGPDKQRQFAAVVAEVLVANALNGILKRSAITNKLTALIFEPLSKRGQNVQLVGGIFETDKRPEFVPVTETPKHKQLSDTK